MRMFVAAVAFLPLLLGGPASGGAEKTNEEPPAAGSATASNGNKQGPVGRFAFVLKDHTQFVGDVLKLDPVALETDFGQVRIPLKLIAGFELAKKKDAVLVHFKNGDTLTARLPLAGLQVKTRYGTVTVPMTELAKATAGDKLPEQSTERPDVPRNVLPDPGRLTGFGAMIGKTLYFRVTGAIGGTIWGTDTYTADSPLATAAVHAGAVKLGKTGIVKVTIVAGLPAHVGSVRNGVSSSSYGMYSFSYRIEKLKRRAAMPSSGRQ